MKIKLIIIILIFTSVSSFGQSVLKSELKKMLTETLVKSRNYVSDATNSWFYDNTENDYKTQDTLTFKTARSFKRDYCKIINWTFYEWNKFRLEFADYCNEPPTKLASKNEDYYEFLVEEKDKNIFVYLKNVNGIQDKFKIVELTKIEPIDSGNDQFDYRIKLTRIK
ncbi:hypothetical protein GCM10011343_03130 [Flavobacterium orientale]|uniref:Uncharacterized protein n=2 Tax=Flavobacterium orientale TaxID=1756020 RepID=A0A917D8T5_9FLAO|nr:hypothetical protein GCM10011343_03130 [Flavobacterium orientale]